MSEITTALGQQIKKLRLQNNWTQEKLAEAADLHVSYVIALEKGSKSASVDTLKKISIAFGISLPELFSFDAGTQTAEDREVTALVQEYTGKLMKIIKK